MDLESKAPWILGIMRHLNSFLEVAVTIYSANISQVTSVFHHLWGNKKRRLQILQAIFISCSSPHSHTSARDFLRFYLPICGYCWCSFSCRAIVCSQMSILLGVSFPQLCVSHIVNSSPFPKGLFMGRRLSLLYLFSCTLKLTVLESSIWERNSWIWSLYSCYTCACVFIPTRVFNPSWKHCQFPLSYCSSSYRKDYI